MNIIFLIIALIIIGYVIIPRIYLRGKKLLEEAKIKAEKEEADRIAKEAELKAKEEAKQLAEEERLAKEAEKARIKKTSRVTFYTDKKEEEQKTDKVCIVQTSKRSYKFTITTEEQTKHDLSYSIRVRATHLVLSELLDIPFDQLVYHSNMPKCAYSVCDKRTMKAYEIPWSQIDATVQLAISYMWRHCK